MLLHCPEQLLSEQHGKPLLKALQQLKTQGITRKIGVSVYGPEELDRLMDEMPFDLVQAPLNILDRRLVESGWARRLKDQGTEVHVRSAFLQGLLLMTPDQRPEKFARWRPVWSEWSRWPGKAGLTPLQACASMQWVLKTLTGLWSALTASSISKKFYGAPFSCAEFAQLASTSRYKPDQSRSMESIMKIVAIVQARMGSTRLPNKRNEANWWPPHDRAPVDEAPGAGQPVGPNCGRNRRRSM